ncbi:MAG: ABC transporter permease [Acidobacteriales bacterium]|nr:ABC transporter permease [Terriglobales bacterium]
MHKHDLIAGCALVSDTFREAMARKIFWALFGLSTALILFFLFLMKIDVVEGAMATVTLFGQTNRKMTDVSRLVRQVHGGIATFLYTWGMALAVFASSGLVPTVLEPGRIELLLSKPVRRWQILLGRYLGNLAVVGLNVAYLIASVWLIFGWKTGVWSPGFLYAIATTVFIFAVLLSVVVLTGVLFESSAVSTMVTIGLGLMSPILAQHTIAEKLLSSEWSRWLWRALYEMLPKVFDVGRITLNLVRGDRVDSLMPLATSGLFALAVLSLSLYIFSKKDF